MTGFPSFTTLNVFTSVNFISVEIDIRDMR